MNRQLKTKMKQIMTAILIIAMLCTVIVIPEKSLTNTKAATRTWVVTLDPGHGGYDGGASRNGIYEKNCNLAIAQYCKAYIEANSSNIKVCLTRNNDSFITLSQRAIIAKNNGSDLFISMHNNSSVNTGANGVEIYIPRYFYNSEMQVFGREVTNNVAAAAGVRNLGVKTRDCTDSVIYKLDADGRPDGMLSPNGTNAEKAEYVNYAGEKSNRVLADYYTIICGGVSRQMPSCIIEHAFVSNDSDRAKLSDSSMLKAMGEADAKAIINYFNTGVKVNDTYMKNEQSSLFNTATTTPYAAYQPYCEAYGLKKWRYEGETAGVTGYSNRLEALTVKVVNVPAKVILNASAYVEGSGWQNKTAAANSGVTIGQGGSGKRIEAIKLSVDKYPQVTLKYRVHLQGYGWLPWVSNGEEAGLAGKGKRIEAIQIKVEYNDAPDITTNEIGIASKAHVQTYGWLDWKINGETAGTTGESKRVEAIKLYLYNAPEGASITAKAHIQTYGWKNYNFKTSGTLGTTGESKRIEAIALTLNGVPGYVLEYRAHVQTYGWTKWMRQGEIAGTSGLSRRLEAIEVRVVPVSKVTNTPFVTYRSHVQTYGWLDWVSENSVSGTSGESKRMEAIQIALHNAAPGMYISGRVHVQTYGWKNYARINPDTLVGTSGQAKRVESINLKLNGTDKYKLQYRVHVQTYGWTNWIDEGNDAGTVGQGKRLEAIQIRIVEK